MVLRKGLCGGAQASVSVGEALAVAVDVEGLHFFDLDIGSVIATAV